MGVPCILLMDNGSVLAEPAFRLRLLAAALGEKSGLPVHPVSLLHSSSVDPSMLGGEPARIFEPFIKEQHDQHGAKSFLVLPLFFGPSTALTEYLPRRIRALQGAGRPGLVVRIASCLVGEDGSGEQEMAAMLADLVELRIAENHLHRPAVVLVDHGTPTLAVNRVRNALADRLRERLGEQVSRLQSCSMERREGPAYDFNEPLLEKLLGRAGFDGEVVLSMMFLLPGRHAGSEGDVEQICRSARERHPQLRTYATDLIGSHPNLIDLLTMRLNQAIEQP